MRIENSKIGNLEKTNTKQLASQHALRVCMTLSKWFLPLIFTFFVFKFESAKLKTFCFDSCPVSFSPVSEEDVVLCNKIVQK